MYFDFQSSFHLKKNEIVDKGTIYSKLKKKRAGKLIFFISRESNRNKIAVVFFSFKNLLC
jgi:hypothetical protein